MRLTHLIAPLALVFFAGTAAMASKGAVIGDDGLHKEVWFYDSFLEMGVDLQEASQEGKGLLVLFEQRGCPYCAQLHEINFARDEIVSLITENFRVVQINSLGSRKVVDFDGEVLEERKLARKWGAAFTPTTVMFPAVNAGSQDWFDAIALLVPGYLKPFNYATSLDYVVSGAYQDISFQKFIRARLAEVRAQGIDPDLW